MNPERIIVHTNIEFVDPAQYGRKLNRGHPKGIPPRSYESARRRECMLNPDLCLVSISLILNGSICPSPGASMGGQNLDLDDCKVKRY